ncbi:sensor domain-containing protein [Methylomonas albis]|uniref:EAL domain-containing protein n=1 Tax=Methylomonas albis TaxID=1854563 RepID=A0ABR9D9B5_9GAMM|nr:GGDEF and EAL domain-containing protein [Methylomonas albis]MBD9358853.1 EAL domain-containing protein [Methylomonas albis]
MSQDFKSDIAAAFDNELADKFNIDTYQALVEHMLNGVAYCRMFYHDDQPNDFIYLYTNPAFEQLTGLKQVVGKPVSEVIPGIRETDPQLLNTYSRVAAGGKPERFETFVESLGMWFWISIYSPLPEHFVAIFDVITERKQIELELIEANERWSLAQRDAAAGAWYWDVGDNIIYWSKELYELFGLDPQTATANFETWRSIIHVDDRQQAENNIYQAIREHLPLSNEYRIITPDCAIRWIRALGNTSYDTDGLPKRMTGICLDITRSKAVEDELRESEARYRQMFQANPHPMWLYDVETLQFLAVNDAAIAHYGYSEQEFLSMTITAIRPPKDVPRLIDHLQQLNGQAQHHSGLWHHRKKDGTFIDVEISSHEIEYEGRHAKIVLAYDVTERQRAEQRIQFLANFDPLTELPNRGQLDDHLRYALSLAKRSNGHLALMFLDLDHFKDINDTLGHSVGDAILIELAKRLRLVLREEDTVTRLGGDEFILLLPGVDVNGAVHVAQKLLSTIAEPFQIEHYDLVLTASIGVAIYPADGVDLETLSKSADTAMYRAKQEGRQGYQFFTQEMQSRSVRNLQIVNALRQAQQLNQLQVYYQPQVSIADGQIIGAEALLRWWHPELGSVSPAEFIPIAEDSRLILSIGEWVIRQAVRQAKDWMKQGFAPLIMAVNLSAVQFRHHDLPALVSRILTEENLPPECLELELTEGVAMHNPQGAIAIMNNLHARGVRMSIDDFGTGYSSLSYLKKFKSYKLKIDQSFVRDINTDVEDKAIVSAIISLAKSLGLKTIAEGVETHDQLSFLKEQGCDEMQGYLISKPLPSDQFEALLNTYRSPSS